MDRMESLVLQVAPSYENAKIREMEQFSWNLQGRQEIHEEGDAEGSSSILGDKYVVTTKVSHYVKLHFVRSLAMPDLDRVRAIEAEYFSLPFLEGPSLKWPIGLAVFFLIGVIVGNPQDPVTARLVFALFTGLCGYWVYVRHQKREVARSTSEASLARRAELASQLAAPSTVIA
jgi:hypothetical protein